MLNKTSHSEGKWPRRESARDDGAKRGGGLGGFRLLHCATGARIESAADQAGLELYPHVIAEPTAVA